MSSPRISRYESRHVHAFFCVDSSTMRLNRIYTMSRRSSIGFVRPTYRDDGGMTGGTLLGQPFTQTPKSDAGRFPDNDLLVVETSLNGGPEGVDVWSDVLAAALDRNTESHEGGFAHARVGGAHVHLQLGRKDREDLLRRQGLGKGIETSEGKLKHQLEPRENN